VANEDDTVVLSIPIVDRSEAHDGRAGDDSNLIAQITPHFGVEFASQTIKPADAENSILTVGLIDDYRFSQECLIKAVEHLHSNLTILPFISVQDCLAGRQGSLDLIIYHWHVNDVPEVEILGEIVAIRQAFPDIPLIVLSDVGDTQQSQALRNTLQSGAHGFIPTRTTGIEIAIAAIRFVKAGGTFAPLDQLLSSRSDRQPSQPEDVRQSRLTSRQTAVLAHLRQGKPNKIIAHALGMSESTVKVHVRNIMRRMGATNRTQAAYKAQQHWDD
jgi:DNA-binding NarL/FixJ family response regulator